MTAVRAGAWLDSRLLALLVVVDGPGDPDWRLRVDRDGKPHELPFGVLDCSSNGTQQVLFAGWLPDALADARPLGPLTLSDGEDQDRFDPDSVATTPGGLADTIVSLVDLPTRRRVPGFLNELATSHEIELTPGLAASLHQIRDTLREPLPQTKLAPGPLCARLERVTVIDAHTFWLTGWIHEADPRQTKLTAITPEGTRIEPDPGATTYHPRPAYANALDDPHTSTLGFHTLIQSPTPSIHPDGWTLELLATNGRRAQDTTPQPTSRDAGELWDHIFDALRTHAGDTDALARQILPTLERLRAHGDHDGDEAPVRTPIERLELITTDEGARGPALEAELWLPGRNTRNDALAHTFGFALEGTLQAPEGETVTVEASHLGALLQTADADLPPARLTGSRADPAGSRRSGFRLVLGTLALPPDFDIEIDAVTAGRRVTLARVRGRRRRLRSRYRPALQPLLIRTMGRSGSTWLMTLLWRHPEIAAYEPIPYEARLADYWMHVLETLSQPDSYIQSLLPQVYGEEWWVGSRRPSPPPQRVPAAQMHRWLGNRRPQELAEFCQSQIDGFYRAFARNDSLPAAYFAEKARRGNTARLIAELYPDGRQLVLVRDFRDMFCSIREFNQRAGLEQWGRGASPSERDWVQRLRVMLDQLLLGWAGRAYLVRYEDLIADPDRTMVGVCEYVGIDADRSRIDRLVSEARARSSGEKRAELSTSSSDEQSIGRWKRDLSPDLRMACADAFEDLLVEFGYEPTFS
jgi:hypothetical protein